MIVGRVLGWILVLAALAVAGWDAFAWYETDAFRLHALGEVWYRLAPGSLNLVQAIVQRYLHPDLWDPVAVTVLLWPGVVLGVPGLALLYLFRRRRRAWFRR